MDRKKSESKFKIQNPYIKYAEGEQLKLQIHQSYELQGERFDKAKRCDKNQTKGLLLHSNLHW
jgi:hypothetical protein